MVNQRTCRPTRTHLVDMDLLHLIKPRHTVCDEHAGEAWGEAGADHHRNTGILRHSVQLQDCNRLCQTVTYEDCRSPSRNGLLCSCQLGPSGAGNNHRIRLQEGWKGMVFSENSITERPCSPGKALSRGIP